MFFIVPLIFYSTLGLIILVIVPYICYSTLNLKAWASYFMYTRTYVPMCVHMHPYGRVLNMFGMGRPMAADALWACAQYVWHGPPYGCGRPMGVCLICLA